MAKNLRLRSKLAGVVALDVPLLWRLRRGIVRLAGSPALHEIYEALGSVVSDADAALRHLTHSDDDLLDGWEPASVGDADRRYPPEYAVSASTEALLYGWVRYARPDVVVEVGVADGRSTASILRAMERNGRGRLVSFDISDDVGGLVTDRSRWDLHVLDPSGYTSAQLADVVAGLGPIDVFFHDARHDYHGQMSDYVVGLPALRPGGLFVSDDVDNSYAFFDVVEEVQPSRGVALWNDRKVAGAFVVPGAVNQQTRTDAAASGRGR